MPARKAASKKRKRAGAGKAPASSRKPGVRNKASGKKRKVSKTRKQSSSRKVSKKKAAARRRPAGRKPAKKKVAKKARGKKKAAKKARKAPSKGPSKKKAAKTRSKKPSRKKKAAPARSSARPSKKKASKKKSSKKAAPKKQAGTNGRTAATPKRTRRSRQDVLSGPIHGIEPYAMKRGEEYMSAEQLEHFRAILSSWKRELMNEVDRTVHHMQDEAANFPDPNDRATQESEFGLELRTRDRERKLLRKIDAALARIDEGTYGYCDETGEEIGLKRLEARPVATLSLEAQERREMAERQFRDRDDRYR